MIFFFEVQFDQFEVLFPDDERLIRKVQCKCTCIAKKNAYSPPVQIWWVNIKWGSQTEFNICQKHLKDWFKDTKIYQTQCSFTIPDFSHTNSVWHGLMAVRAVMKNVALYMFFRSCPVIQINCMHLFSPFDWMIWKAPLPSKNLGQTSSKVDKTDGLKHQV